MNSAALFAPGTEPIQLGAQVVLLPRFADGSLLSQEIARLTALSALRRFPVPGGKLMSVAMTNCGRLGWVSSPTGYRYDAVDPLTDQPWPAMPACFRLLARQAAQLAGYADFAPDACLINHYEPGAQLGLHRDSDERDFSQPIVSVSLGASARFSVGGRKRTDPKTRVLVTDGDVVVWGGDARLIYHAVGRPLAGSGPQGESERFNLTFRQAG